MKKNKNKFKENFKNRFRKVFGSDENISFKISSAFLISAIIFGILGWIHKDDNYLTTALTYASSMGFAFWMVIAKGIEYSGNVIYELVRLLVFLTILVLSMNYLLKMSSLNILLFIITCLGVFVSCIYIISKLSDIYNFMKELFIVLKMKLFNIDKSTSTGIKAMIENITVFLVVVSGFFIAIKTIIETIIETIFQIQGLF